MTLTRKLLGVIGLVALLSSASANGNEIFSFSSTCGVGCAGVGLASGDAVSGSFTVLDSAVSPFGTISLADIVSATLTFGSLSFSLPDFVSALIALDGTGTAAAGMLITGINAGGAFQLINDGAAQNFWLVQPAGADLAGGGPIALVAVAPEPATALLLLAGLVAAGLRRRSHP
jgi:hypothetical protein